MFARLRADIPGLLAGAVMQMQWHTPQIETIFPIVPGETITHRDGSIAVNGGVGVRFKRGYLR